MTPVQTPGQRGSFQCVSTTGSRDDLWRLSSGNLVPLSEQQVESPVDGQLSPGPWSAQRRSSSIEDSAALAGLLRNCGAGFLALLDSTKQGVDSRAVPRTVTLMLVSSITSTLLSGSLLRLVIYEYNGESLSASACWTMLGGDSRADSETVLLFPDSLHHRFTPRCCQPFSEAGFSAWRARAQRRNYGSTSAWTTMWRLP